MEYCGLVSCLTARSEEPALGGERNKREYDASRTHDQRHPSGSSSYRRPMQPSRNHFQLLLPPRDAILFAPAIYTSPNPRHVHEHVKLRIVFGCWDEGDPGRAASKDIYVDKRCEIDVKGLLKSGGEDGVVSVVEEDLRGPR